MGHFQAHLVTPPMNTSRPADGLLHCRLLPMTGSPYNGIAYCEQFPRNSSLWGNATAAADAAAADVNSTFQYWAQVGKTDVPDSRFDNIGWALITVFQIITTENW